jgi:CubicO group peptidase (beta-lactamase class C family)
VIDALWPKGFSRAVEEHILNPLGMNDTALGAADSSKAGVIARMAKPYRLDADFKVVESTTFTPPLDYISAASGIISTVMDLAKYDVAIDRDKVYSPQVKQQIWTPAKSPAGQKFPYGLGWFVWEPFAKFYWHYGWYSEAFSSLLFKVPDRELTLILLACTDRASSVFWLGSGDPLRSAFVTAFLDSFGQR